MPFDSQTVIPIFSFAATPTVPFHSIGTTGHHAYAWCICSDNPPPPCRMLLAAAPGRDLGQLSVGASAPTSQSLGEKNNISVTTDKRKKNDNQYNMF